MCLLLFIRVGKKSVRGFRLFRHFGLLYLISSTTSPPPLPVRLGIIHTRVVVSWLVSIFGSLVLFSNWLFYHVSVFVKACLYTLIFTSGMTSFLYRQESALLARSPKEWAICTLKASSCLTLTPWTSFSSLKSSYAWQRILDERP